MELLGRRKQIEKSTDTFVKIMLGMYFVLSIFEVYLNGVLGSVTKYYMFFVMFVLLWRERFCLRLYKLSFVYIGWLLMLIISLLWSEDYYTPQMHFISQVGMVLYTVIFISYRWDGDMIDAVKDIYWLASVAMGVLSVLFAETYRGTAYGRNILYIMGVEIDPNNQAALMLVGVSISMSNIFYEKRRIIPSAIGLLINVYACLATASRSGLVTLLAMALFCVIIASERRGERGRLKRYLLIGAVVVIMAYIAFNFLEEDSLNRLFDFDSYEGGSNRDVLWGETWELYTRDPLTVLIGAGWGTVAAYISKKGVHNTYLEMLCNVGLLGTLLFLVPIIYIAIKLLRKKEPTPVLLLLAQFAPAFFLGAINKRFFWNAILILFMYYYKQSEKIPRDTQTA